MMKYNDKILMFLFVFISFISCREDDLIFESDTIQVAIPRPDVKILGFYQLNEGNMGMNRASIDLFVSSMAVVCEKKSAQSSSHNLKTN